MMMMSSNSIGSTGGGKGLNDPKFANWNNRFQKILQKDQGLHRFQKLYTELHNNLGGRDSLDTGAFGTETDKAANEIRWTYDKPTQAAITDIKKIRLALKDMEDGTVDDATNQKILAENNLTQYKDAKFTKEDVQKIAKESLEAWEQVDKRLADEEILDPDRASVKAKVQTLINTKNKLLKDLQYGTDGKTPVINVATDAGGKQVVTPLYDENVIDPTVALKVTHLQQLMGALAPYEEALKSTNQDGAIDELLKPKQDAMVALATKLKTIKDSDTYRNSKDWWNWGQSTWFYGKDISKENGFDEIFDENLSEINQIYASISGANVDNRGNLVGGFLKSGKSGTISEKEATFSLDELEGLSISKNGKPIVVGAFKDNKDYTPGPAVKSPEGVTAKVWLPKDETVEASEGITFNGMPVIVTKDAKGKLLARVIEINKSGNGVIVTQMPLNFDPKKAKGADGKYKTQLTQDDMLPPNKGESVRLFTYAFNSQGEPEGNVIMTPSPSGLPKTFNELPGIVKAKLTARSYADPVTFPPDVKFSAEQTNLTSTYNYDLALLQGSSIPAMSQAPAAPNMATVQPQPQVQVVQQPVNIPPQPIQLPQQQIVQQPIFPPNYIAPAVQPTGVVSGSIPMPAQQPVQQQQLIYSVPPQVQQPVQPTATQPQVTSPLIAPTTTYAPVRSVLNEPDLLGYTQYQLTSKPKASGWE